MACPLGPPCGYIWRQIITNSSLLASYSPDWGIQGPGKICILPWKTQQTEFYTRIELFTDYSIYNAIRFNHLITDTTFHAWREKGLYDLYCIQIVWDTSLSIIGSVNSRHQLIQFNIIYRLHYSESCWNKISLSVSVFRPLWDRCKMTEGTMSCTF